MRSTKYLPHKILYWFREKTNNGAPLRELAVIPTSPGVEHAPAEHRGIAHKGEGVVGTRGDHHQTLPSQAGYATWVVAITLITSQSQAQLRNIVEYRV